MEPYTWRDVKEYVEKGKGEHLVKIFSKKDLEIAIAEYKEAALFYAGMLNAADKILEKNFGTDLRKVIVDFLEEISPFDGYTEINIPRWTMIYLMGLIQNTDLKGTTGTIYINGASVKLTVKKGKIEIPIGRIEGVKLIVGNAEKKYVFIGKNEKDICIRRYSKDWRKIEEIRDVDKVAKEIVDKVYNFISKYASISYS